MSSLPPSIMHTSNEVLTENAYMDALVARCADEGLRRLCTVGGKHQAMLVDPLDALQTYKMPQMRCHSSLLNVP